MSVWDKYPDLTDADMRTVVAITAQLLLESDDGRAEFPSDLLLQSTAASARGIQKELIAVDPTISRQDVQSMLEDDELARRACLGVLDRVKAIPELAARIDQEYEARKQKMTGIETVLLAGALVVLATRIKSLKWSGSGGSVIFDPAGNAVKTFLVGLIKAITSGQP